MGRPKKVVVEGGSSNSSDESPKRQERVKIVAKFKSVDEEGNKIVLPFDSEGDNIEEALNNLVFPKGVNALVNVSLSQGGKRIDRALAPHKARQTLEHKDVDAFVALFRGF